MLANASNVMVKHKKKVTYYIFKINFLFVDKIVWKVNGS